MSMGISPVEHMTISCEPPSTPYSLDELEFAGGHTGSPVELVTAKTTVAPLGRSLTSTRQSRPRRAKAALPNGPM